MVDSNANSNTPTSPPTKRGGWRRLFFWGFLASGGGLFVLLVFLISVTVPNLRREVPPPDISGPQQVSQSQSSPDHPTSKTLSISSPTSGTQSFLNLDEFPLLSPKMRKLTQAWLDQLDTTSQALETISDPAQRAQVLAYLTASRERIREILNLPLKWDNQTFEDTDRYLNARSVHPYSEIPNPAMPSFKDYGEWNLFRSTYPEFDKAFQQEEFNSFILTYRMGFEFYIHNGHWNSAAYNCIVADKRHCSTSTLRGDMNSWEEEVYCLQQMGAPGWAGLAGRSYQRALDSRWQDQPVINKFQATLRMVGYLPLAVPHAIKRKKARESESAAKNPD